MINSPCMTLSNSSQAESLPFKSKILLGGLGASLEKWQLKVEAAINADPLLFGQENSPLSRACFYALESGGKRFRPAIVYMIGEALLYKGSLDEAALAVEMFHTASLIADDLPCMDNDDMRRGRASLHKEFGEGVALLASYALIAEGYGMIGKALTPDHDPKILKFALENSARNTGANGAAGGQLLDLYPPDLKPETVLEILNKKTVTLFEVAFVLGWLFSGGSPEKLEEVKRAAYHFGMAFQIADDLDDLKQDASRENAANIAVILGIEATKNLFLAETDAFKQSLEKLGLEKSELSAIIEILIQTGV